MGPPRRSADGAARRRVFRVSGARCAQARRRRGRMAVRESGEDYLKAILAIGRERGFVRAALSGSRLRLLLRLGGGGGRRAVRPSVRRGRAFALEAKRRAELLMARADPALCASAPATGPRRPTMASAMTTKLSVRRERHVQLDDGHHALRDGDHVGERSGVVAHERDVGGVHGSVAARAAHGDAGRRALEGGCVVDAVAHHANRRATVLEALDGAQLVLGQAIGLHVADARLLGKARRPSPRGGRG